MLIHICFMFYYNNQTDQGDGTVGGFGDRGNREEPRRIEEGVKHKINKRKNLVSKRSL
jgi:hypothetical protein